MEESEYIIGYIYIYISEGTYENLNTKNRYYQKEYVVRIFRIIYTRDHWKY